MKIEVLLCYFVNTRIFISVMNLTVQKKFIDRLCKKTNYFFLYCRKFIKKKLETSLDIIGLEKLFNYCKEMKKYLQLFIGKEEKFF